MEDFLALYFTDSYKVGHNKMTPIGTLFMYSNETPRSGKHSNVNNNGKIVSFGQQMLWMKIQEIWQKGFFDRPESDIDQFATDMKAHLMMEEDFDVTHMKELHRLGYLPLSVKSMVEGTLLPYGVPMMTFKNSQPMHGTIVHWITNFLETILSTESWQAPTSATTGRAFIKLGTEWAMKTDPENLWFVDYQFHDFSMRGMGGVSSVVNSGLGFATASRGSDVLPVIPASRKYYGVKLDEMPINSVVATEHSIMCSLTGFYLVNGNGKWEKAGEFELETFRHLLRLFPSGILSIVSDTWDLWEVITVMLKELKGEIMARDGKVVIRPDSGNPVDIVCGTNKEISSEISLSDMEPSFLRKVQEGKGVVELLWDIFGGDESSTGYKRLDSHIGCIYGDSINFQRATDIFTRLEAKGFASTNVVLGVGSYSLQMVTRDTHGFAVKATAIGVERNYDAMMRAKNVEGSVYTSSVETIPIFKDPITDDGTKKSAKGFLQVLKDENGVYYLNNNCTAEEEATGELQVIFEDGKFFNTTTFEEIRGRIKEDLQLELNELAVA
jgi:nicotinamide phosphoribosyltransferase